MASTRNTIQKSMIMQALEILDHPSAEEVFRSVSEKYPSISKATVYRNLNQMAECGEILRLTITESADHYDLRCTPHYHAHCKSCGKIIDIFPEKEMVSKMENLLGSETGFETEKIDVIFSGICAKCSGQRKN